MSDHNALELTRALLGVALQLNVVFGEHVARAMGAALCDIFCAAMPTSEVAKYAELTVYVEPLLRPPWWELPLSSRAKAFRASCVEARPDLKDRWQAMDESGSWQEAVEWCQVSAIADYRTFAERAVAELAERSPANHASALARLEDDTGIAGVIVLPGPGGIVILERRQYTDADGVRRYGYFDPRRLTRSGRPLDPPFMHSKRAP